MNVLQTPMDFLSLYLMLFDTILEKHLHETDFAYICVCCVHSNGPFETHQFYVPRLTGWNLSNDFMNSIINLLLAYPKWQHMLRMSVYLLYGSLFYAPVPTMWQQ